MFMFLSKSNPAKFGLRSNVALILLFFWELMMWGNFTINKSKGSNYWMLLVFTELCQYILHRLINQSTICLWEEKNFQIQNFEHNFEISWSKSSKPYNKVISTLFEFCVYLLNLILKEMFPIFYLYLQKGSPPHSICYNRKIWPSTTNKNNYLLRS